MDREPDAPERRPAWSDGLVAIILKSIGIAAILTGIAWFGTAVAFRYLG